MISSSVCVCMGTNLEVSWVQIEEVVGVGEGLLLC